MFKGYNELEKLEPQEYLNWQQFETPFDNLPSHRQSGYAEKKYNEGLSVGAEYDYITLSVRGVWSAGTWDCHRSCNAYEGIGYHACTKDLLHGFLDSGKPIMVARWGKDNTWIVGNPPEGWK